MFLKITLEKKRKGMEGKEKKGTEKKGKERKEKRKERKRKGMVLGKCIPSAGVLECLLLVLKF